MMIRDAKDVALARGIRGWLGKIWASRLRSISRRPANGEGVSGEGFQQGGPDKLDPKCPLCLVKRRQGRIRDNNWGGAGRKKIRMSSRAKTCIHSTPSSQ